MATPAPGELRARSVPVGLFSPRPQDLAHGMRLRHPVSEHRAGQQLHRHEKAAEVMDDHDAMNLMRESARPGTSMSGQNRTSQEFFVGVSRSAGPAGREVRNRKGGHGQQVSCSRKTPIH